MFGFRVACCITVKNFLRLVGLWMGIFMLSNSGHVMAEELINTTIIRTLYPQEWNVAQPTGVAYSTTLGHLFLLDQEHSTAQSSTIVVLTLYEELVQRVELDFPLDNVLNMTFDDHNQRLLLFNANQAAIGQIEVDQEGHLDPSTLIRLSTAHLHLGTVAGMAVDSAENRLLFLDSSIQQVVSVDLNPTAALAKQTTVDLSAWATSDLQGIAIHPQSHHLYIGNATQRLFYELTPAGELIATYSVATPLESVASPQRQGFVFATSADLTDPPETIHLLLADRYFAGDSTRGAKTAQRHGEILEIALTNFAALTKVAAAPPLPLTLVQTVNTAFTINPLPAATNQLYLPLIAADATNSTGQNLNTPTRPIASPDPSGIIYLPTTNRFLICDGEVDEMPSLFTGANLFETTLSGSLVVTGTTLAYSIEPTGIGFNPINHHLFISDDDKREIFEIAPGVDGLPNTADDIVTSFDTAQFNSLDPEGVTYSSADGLLFIVDGINNEVYQVSAGANGIFDGAPAAGGTAGGDDVITNFDIQAINIFDPEGIYYDAASGHLFLIANNQGLIYEITTTGTLVQRYSTVAAQLVYGGDITLAPSSQQPAITNFYIVDRGIDNGVDPTENDGRLYEFTLSSTNPSE
jgi:uncharacterized protein YjiK